MTPFQNQSPTLTYDVFALKRPGLTRDVPPGTESLQWTANTATLIAGAHMPFPSLGRLRKEGAGYVWVPVIYGDLR